MVNCTANSSPNSELQCECDPGFTGSNCEININECTPDPCQNGGTRSDLVNDFSCSCVDGFTGTTCETNINECADSPCLNGGTCVDLVNAFQCQCLESWNGTTCSTCKDGFYLSSNSCSK